MAANELNVRQLRKPDLLWLPRRSRRQFTAGPDGRRYLTMHQWHRALARQPLRSPVRQAV
jgi:hypothetical protein